MTFKYIGLTHQNAVGMDGFGFRMPHFQGTAASILRAAHPDMNARRARTGTLRNIVETNVNCVSPGISRDLKSLAGSLSFAISISTKRSSRSSLFHISCSGLGHYGFTQPTHCLFIIELTFLERFLMNIGRPEQR